LYILNDTTYLQVRQYNIDYEVCFPVKNKAVKPDSDFTALFIFCFDFCLFIAGNTIENLSGCHINDMA
jgi:hypothetical protein